MPRLKAVGAQQVGALLLLHQLLAGSEYKFRKDQLV
jgi:hypothetical protein